MAHQAQKDFFIEVKTKYPDFFNNVKVIDCGSLDVNGSLRDMFTNSDYLGVDIVSGKNVDLVSAIKNLPYENATFDAVISGEMLEHDESWKESLEKMYKLCKKGGLIAISAAGKDRPEHGTRRTGAIWGTAPDYYMNIEEHHIRSVYTPDMFTESEVRYNPVAKDIYFFGIKA